MRFGIANSALWATATTAASNGSVNSMHDSFTPLGGLVPLWLMQLGEVIFGGVGSGLYGMLVFAIVAVFIAGLMVGRTPEYLGKKIEAYEMKMASLGILVPPRRGARSARRSPWSLERRPRRRAPTPARTASARSSTPSPRPATTTAAPSPASPRTRPSTTLALGLAMLVRPLLGRRPGPRHRRLAGRQEVRAARRRDAAHAHAALRRPAGRHRRARSAPSPSSRRSRSGPIVEHLQMVAESLSAERMNQPMTRTTRLAVRSRARPDARWSGRFREARSARPGQEPGDVRRRGRQLR